MKNNLLLLLVLLCTGPQTVVASSAGAGAGGSTDEVSDSKHEESSDSISDFITLVTLESKDFGLLNSARESVHIEVSINRERDNLFIMRINVPGNKKKPVFLALITTSLGLLNSAQIILLKKVLVKALILCEKEFKSAYRKDKSKYHLNIDAFVELVKKQSRPLNEIAFFKEKVTKEFICDHIEFTILPDRHPPLPKENDEGL